MKRLTVSLFTIVLSFTVLSLPSIIEARGGHGGGGHGGGHHGGPHGGHYGYPQTGSHYGGTYFSRGYFPSPYPRCDSCHRGLKGLGFGRCKYLGINFQEAVEHNAMIEESIKSEKYGPDWRLREIGP